MMAAKQDSAAVKFVRLAWGHAGGDPLSWERYNHQVGQACRIIADGFEWAPGDADKILSFSNTRYSIHKCLGEGGVEDLYARAVAAANMSACLELERYLDREPIIADNVRFTTYGRWMESERKRDRLCVGSEFRWDDRRVRVTSFDGEGRARCVPVEGKRRLYRVSAKDIKADRKQRKAGRAGE